MYAEDTRRTRVLLRHVDSQATLRSLHAHNEAARTEELLERLAAGESCALVTDAGMPGISDPGSRAIEAAARAGFRVVPVPGPSAVLTALAISGLPASRFAFLGFPPRGGRRRQEWLGQAARSSMTVVAFESPRRLASLLSALAAGGLGERQCVVCRELTKVHEEIRRGTVSSLAEYYSETEPRGEVTLVFEGLSGPRSDVETEGDRCGEAERAAREMAKRGRTTSEIVRSLIEQYGLPRNGAYRIALRVGKDEG